MKKTIQNIFKSNKGFTVQDLAIAIIAIFLFAGLIGTMYLYIYQVQAETKLTSVATLYAVQILENIDKISFEEVTNGMEEQYKAKFGISNQMKLKLEVTDYKTDNLVKNVKLTIMYTLSGKEQTLNIERLKIKEA